MSGTPLPPGRPNGDRPRLVPAGRLGERPELHAPPAADPSRLPPLERFRPFTRRQKLLIVAVAVGTSATILVSMLTPHIAYLRAKLSMKPPEPPEVAACAPGQTEGCVGGTMGVIMVAPAPAPSPAASR